MKTPQQVLADLDRRLATTWQHTIAADPNTDRADRAEGAGLVWPLHVPLGKPTKADLETRFADASRWARDWYGWAGQRSLTLTTSTRLVHGTRQDLPTHLTIPDIDTAATLLRGSWPARLARARARHAVLRGQFPHAANPSLLRYVEALTETDFALLCTAAHWFTGRDAAGLTPRQVPIEGLHGKWLNQHRAVLTALAGKEHLGLIERPTRIHFTYLDPAHRAAGGRHHDSLTLTDTAAPAYRPSIVVITENKDTAVYFPELPDAVAVEGGGTAGSGLLPQVDWVRAADHVLYWGDMDARGYEIVNALRANGVPARTVLMDLTTYHAYERFGAWTDTKGDSLTCRTRKALPLLTDAERAVYEAVTDPDWSGPRLVEQERIPLPVALAAVTAAVRAAAPRSARAQATTALA